MKRKVNRLDSNSSMTTAVGWSCLRLFFAIVGVGFSVAKVAYGSEFISSCPDKGILPVYIVIGGCLAVLLTSLKQEYDYNEQCEARLKLGTCVLAISVNLAWLIAGTVWTCQLLEASHYGSKLCTDKDVKTVGNSNNSSTYVNGIHNDSGRTTIHGYGHDMGALAQPMVDANYGVTNPTVSGSIDDEVEAVDTQSNVDSDTDDLADVVNNTTASNKQSSDVDVLQGNIKRIVETKMNDTKLKLNTKHIDTGVNGDMNKKRNAASGISDSHPEDAAADKIVKTPDIKGLHNLDDQSTPKTRYPVVSDQLHSTMNKTCIHCAKHLMYFSLACVITDWTLFVLGVLYMCSFCFHRVLTLRYKFLPTNTNA